MHIPTPSEGEVVTFSYEINARRDLPVSPIIYRTRTDVEWDDLLRSDTNEQTYLINNGITKMRRGGRGEKGPRKPYLSLNSVRTDLKHNFDAKYNFENEVKLMQMIEPMQKKIFTSHPPGFWTLANMRAYMEDLAHSYHMDPLVADTWLNIPFKAVSQTKV